MTRYVGSSSSSQSASGSARAPMHASTASTSTGDPSKNGTASANPSGRPSVDAASAARPRVFGPSQHMASRNFFGTPLGDYDQGDLDRDDDDKHKNSNGGSHGHPNADGGDRNSSADGVYSQKGASKLSKRDLENLRLAQMFKAKKFDIPDYNLHSNMDEVAYDVTRIQQELSVRELVQREKNRYMAITTGLEAVLSFLAPSLPITQIRQDIEAALNEQEFNLEKKYWSGPPPTVNHSPKDFLMALFLPVAYRLIETYQKNREQQRQQQMQQQRNAAFQSYMYGNGGAFGYGFPPYCMPDTGMPPPPPPPPQPPANADASATGSSGARSRKTFTRKNGEHGNGSTDWFGSVLSMVTKLFSGGRNAAADDDAEYVSKSAPGNHEAPFADHGSMMPNGSGGDGSAPWSVPFANGGGGYSPDLFGSGGAFGSNPAGMFAPGMDPTLATPFDFSMFDGSVTGASLTGDDALAFSAFDTMFGTVMNDADGLFPAPPASDSYMAAPPTPAPAPARPPTQQQQQQQPPTRTTAPPTPAPAPRTPAPAPPAPAAPPAFAKSPMFSAPAKPNPIPESRLPPTSTSATKPPANNDKAKPSAPSPSPGSSAPSASASFAPSAPSASSAPSAPPATLPAASPGPSVRRRANLAPPPFVPAPVNISSASAPPQTPKNKPLAEL